VRSFGLCFSGHSLGAGAAAVASDLLRRHPDRFPTLFEHLAPSRITCFCAAPPPVFSLDIARATYVHTTSLVLGHDIVVRGSLANLEQLRLEVLSSRWWEVLLDPVMKNKAIDRVGATLTAVGAASLVLLAGSGQGGGQEENKAGETMREAFDMLHHLYIKPTVCARAHCIEKFERAAAKQEEPISIDEIDSARLERQTPAVCRGHDACPESGAYLLFVHGFWRRPILARPPNL
jgi:hypothetical protein